jgi:hypothetical protein
MSALLLAAVDIMVVVTALPQIVSELGAFSNYPLPRCLNRQERDLLSAERRSRQLAAP